MAEVIGTEVNKEMAIIDGPVPCGEHAQSLKARILRTVHYEQSVVQCDRGAAYSIAGLVSLPRGLPLR